MSHVVLCWKRICENVDEWTRKAEIRKRELQAVGETRKGTFWPTPHLEERTFDSSGGSADGTLISTFTVPRIKTRKEKKEKRGKKGGGGRVMKNKTLNSSIRSSSLPVVSYLLVPNIHLLPNSPHRWRSGVSYSDLYNRGMIKMSSVLM